MLRRIFFGTLVLLPFVAVAGVPMKTQNLVQEHYFMLTLPPGWSGGATADPTLWQYRSQNGEEQLSVSIFVSKTPITEQERSKMLETVLLARLKAEATGAKGKGLKISGPKKKQQKDSTIATYSGYDPGSNRRFSNITIVNNKIIANLYFEGLDMSKGQFAKDSKQVLHGVKITK